MNWLDTLKALKKYFFCLKCSPKRPLPTPLKIYTQQSKAGKIKHDEAQYQALLILEQHYHFVSQSSWTFFGKSRFSSGVYLWGGVGRGKTFLMDLFYMSLPTEKKARYHFHRFMQIVHELLKMHQGRRNPMQFVAKKLSQGIRVLCFDELLVSDIADAMILSELFRYLFASDLLIVLTSNLPPAQLYRNGLQRERFLPTIQLIEKHMQIFCVTGEVDFRLQYLEKEKIYHFPLDAQARKHLEDAFRTLSQSLVLDNPVLYFSGRAIPTYKCAGDIVWFSFHALCNTPRSVQDYNEIARSFRTIIVSEIPILNESNEDAAQRFIFMIDSFYDHHVVLLFSAAVAIDALYQGTKLQFDFQRTKSRLHEMQTVHYLHSDHI